MGASIVVVVGDIRPIQWISCGTTEIVKEYALRHTSLFAFVLPSNGGVEPTIFCEVLLK